MMQQRFPQMARRHLERLGAASDSSSRKGSAVAWPTHHRLQDEVVYEIPPEQLPAIAAANYYAWGTAPANADIRKPNSATPAGTNSTRGGAGRHYEMGFTDELVTDFRATGRSTTTVSKSVFMVVAIRG
jgi:hypothetical protein